ncbi:MAG: chemotaxis protein CheX [Clostridiaceae bacterium]|nr:chemotaxis protein CheX [Clostridiaceae bacterium]
METKLYEIFLEATRSVFELMLDLSQIGDHKDKELSGKDEIDVCIGVTGDLEGDVVYRFPNSTSINMVKIMSGMDIDSVDDFVTSAVSEISNIISGNVMTMLAGTGLNCDILPPELHGCGDSSKNSISNASCYLSTSVGDICLDIRLNPAK